MSGYVMSCTCSVHRTTIGGKCLALPSKCNDNSLKINPLTGRYEWLCNDHWTQLCKTREWDTNLTNAVNYRATLTKLRAESRNKCSDLELQLSAEQNRCASLTIAFSNTTEYLSEELRFCNTTEYSSGGNNLYNSTNINNMRSPLLS